ncbi:hypothetical protein AAE478_001930 [Parahypoxylon ruwenzoriense]
MPPRYDEAPELAPDSFPEVHHPPSVPEVYEQHGQYPLVTPVKLEDLVTNPTNPPTIHSSYAPVTNSVASPYVYEHRPAYNHTLPSERGKRPKRICGCSVLVFILSVIIAILSAAVIGLAAGTGVEASRANDAEARLAALSGPQTTVTVTAPTSSSTPIVVDRGCSTNSAGVTGTTYTSQFFDKPTFRIYCNSDAPNYPLQSLFVANFDDCVDACASYSFYIPSDFSNSTASNNVTCAGLSYIPAWANRTVAFDGNAPGNCYLKPGPQNETGLNNPNVGGVAVHAAILNT